MSAVWGRESFDELSDANLAHQVTIWRVAQAQMDARRALGRDVGAEQPDRTRHLPEPWVARQPGERAADGLRAARGVLIGVLASLGLWALGGWAVEAALRAVR